MFKRRQRSAAVATALLALDVLASAGCPGAFSTRCASNQECPRGFDCWAEVCVPHSTTDGGSALDTTAAHDARASDAVLPDRPPLDATRTDARAADQRPNDATGTDHLSIDAGTAAGCGSVQVLQDNFGDGTSAPLWWGGGDYGSSIVESTGSVVLTFTVGPAEAYASYDSREPFRLREAAMRIAVVRGIDANDPSGSAWFRFSQDEGNRVGWRISNNQLTKQLWIGNSDQSQSVGQFNDIADRWWQLRETGGRVYFETSPDGQNWAGRGSIDTPDFADVGTIQIGAGHYDPLQAVEVVEYAHFNSGIAPVPLCPASSLQDALTGANLSAEWEDVSDPGCMLLPSSNGLLIRTPRAQVDCRIQSARHFKLDESGLLVHIASAPAQHGITAGLVLSASGGLWWEYGLHDDTVVAYGEINGSQVFSDNLPRGNLRWLRISKVGGSLVFEAKDDQPNSTFGQIWTVLVNHPFDAIHPGLSTNVWSTPATGGPFDATFLDFNLP